MENKEGFLSARPQKFLALHTTHSPDFLRLHQNVGVRHKSNYGKRVIIGVIDSGITPDHPSFNDKNMPRPPPKWKGRCQFRSSACNNKLIGMREFISDRPGLPYDEVRHGTHTASTAAGNFVPNANVFNNAKGTAVGMAPCAHLAIYRACLSDGCIEADVLAAMDAAVEDGVDVLSNVLGGYPSLISTPFFDDGIAIGPFGAIQNGVF